LRPGSGSIETGHPGVPVGTPPLRPVLRGYGHGADNQYADGDPAGKAFSGTHLSLPFNL